MKYGKLFKIPYYNELGKDQDCMKIIQTSRLGMNKITKNAKKNVRGIAFDEISFQFYS